MAETTVGIHMFPSEMAILRRLILKELLRVENGKRYSKDKYKTLLEIKSKIDEYIPSHVGTNVVEVL